MRQCVHSPGETGNGGRCRKARPVVALLLGLAVAGAGPLRAQGGSVGGTVYDQTSGRPLTGAQVAVVGAQRGVLTDANGHFRLAGLTGALRLLTGLGWPMIYFTAAFFHRRKYQSPLRQIVLAEEQSIEVVGLLASMIVAH